MRTSRKTDFRKLKITLVALPYPGQYPQCPSLFPHVLLLKLYEEHFEMYFGVSAGRPLLW